MADETHGGVPVSPVREGAARTAPTSPHATEPTPDPARKRTGPERFWRRGRTALALAVCSVLSIALHYAVAPWSVLPSESIHLHDSDEDLAIPIDLIAMPAEPPPPPPPAPRTTAAAAAKGEGPGRSVDDAGAKRASDAGGPRDAGPADASPDGDTRDASVADGSSDASASDAMVAENGAPDGGGALEGVASGPAFVKVAIDIAVIRTNRVGAQLGPLLRGIPQWDEFMGGTDVDAIRDLDWIYIFGPGLIHTEKDAVLIRYNMPDARAAKNIATLSRKDSSGGAWDAGVPGVKAWRGHADRAWRVFMLPQPGYAAMVPPEFAPKAARAFSHAAPRIPFRPDEAVRFTVQNASHALQGQVPDGLGELRLWVTPRADGGADAFAEIDAPDEATAGATARRLRAIVHDLNSLAVKIVTRGVLDGVETGSEGARVTARLSASEEQLAALYDVTAAFLGVNTPPIGASLPPRGAANAPAARP